ncbi:MAG: FAD-dependent oxidoreductase [Lachnospiraceae bacterium]|nr:FAD-dependent oxidoreductase [Lachnospiraceae bacterium]
MESIWSEEVTIPQRKELIGGLNVEVAVIGAGMAGLLTAFFLKEHGCDVVVLEAERIAGGQTKHTTAKITSQHGLIYDKLIRNCGMEKAGLYAKANEWAIGAYEKIIEDKNFACDFQRLPSYLYSIKQTESLMAEADAAAALGIKAYYTKKNKLPFPTAGEVCFENQAQFHPLKFIRAISEGITIYENTRVISVKQHVIYTERGTVTANHIVFATHYPFINIPGFYFIRQHQERSYVLALSGAAQLKGMYYGIDRNTLSFRNSGDILLLGGGAHRTGENREGGSYEMLRKEARKLYPNATEIAHWSAQDCMPHDEIPFIGKYSKFRPYWYVATGFKKWGMTNSMIAAMIISDMIQGKENEYAELFTPQRFYFRASMKNLLKDIGKSTKGLVKGSFHFPFTSVEKLPEGYGGIVRKGFRRYGVYKDEQGVIHQISAKCPHMGCELEWNPDELSWDCPCHGSRYDCDGKLIDNPAQINKHYTENS